jgi:hypothetical protein
MKKCGLCFGILVVLYVLLPGPGLAGSVTMEPDEVAVLRTLLARDAPAAAHFAMVRKVADAALLVRPDPVVQVVSEGRLASDPKKVRTVAALKDMAKAEALAWTWAVTADTRYANKGREYILAWVAVNQSDGNPINETKFEPLIEAYDLLRSGFSQTDRATVDDWLRKKASLLLSSTRGAGGNWQSHRIKIVGLISATIEDPNLWKAAEDAFKDQIRNSFESSGVSIDFKRRDAMHYHLYSIQPLLAMACVAQRRGDALYTYRADSGASLERAVEFVVPYAAGEKKHVEFANSEVQFDRKRAAAGEKNYIPHDWSPKSATSMFAEAGCVDPRYNKFAASVSGFPDKPYANWRTVLNVASGLDRPR